MNNEITRGLSVRQPYAWAICAGVKRTENRTWTTSYRGTIAIHASTSTADVREVADLCECDLIQPSRFRFGAIIGLADIVDVAVYGPGFEADPFACGPYCWTMGNPRFLREPIPLSGKLNLFKLDDRVQQRLRAAETFTLDLDRDPTDRIIASAMSVEPDPLIGYDTLFDEYFYKGEFGDYLRTVADRVIDLGLEEPVGYLIRGCFRFEDGEDEEAARDLLRATQLDDEDPRAWFLLSQVYAKLGKYDYSLDAADELIRFEPEEPWG